MMGFPKENIAEGNNQQLSTNHFTVEDCTLELELEFFKSIEICEMQDVGACSQSINSFLSQYPDVKCKLEDELKPSVACKKPIGGDEECEVVEEGGSDNQDFFVLTRGKVELIPKINLCERTVIGDNVYEDDNDDGNKNDVCDNKVAEDYSRVSSVCNQYSIYSSSGEEKKLIGACKESIDVFLEQHPDYSTSCEIREGEEVMFVLSRTVLEQTSKVISCVQDEM